MLKKMICLLMICWISVAFAQEPILPKKYIIEAADWFSTTFVIKNETREFGYIEKEESSDPYYDFCLNFMNTRRNELIAKANIRKERDFKSPKFSINVVDPLNHPIGTFLITGTFLKAGEQWKDIELISPEGKLLATGDYKTFFSDWTFKDSQERELFTFHHVGVFFYTYEVKIKKEKIDPRLIPFLFLTDALQRFIPQGK